MANKDRSMMAICISDDTKSLFEDFKCDHPLDEKVIDKIKALYDSIRDGDDDYEIFRHRDQTDVIWKLLIEKAIKCLRYFDEREPFMDNSEKTPKAYGIEELDKYYKKYTEFERILYGSSQYYRDHVVHVFRTWLSGVECLVKNHGAYLNCISIQEKEEIKLNNVEKLSIWTIIALTHDLGYPLEKAKDIISTTRSMVATFVTNPDISMDLSFHGVQNYMNDFIVRLMSSKMICVTPEENLKSKTKTNPKAKAKEYVARLQPKYYFKFQKSLERTQHGIVSTLIIYKLLTYFLESDYNINEDYRFNEDDRRQFYIRREILRAIASHTCNDVYHLYMGTFAFLLIIADDTQEWGRKYISELYVQSNNEHELDEIDITIASSGDSSTSHKCKVSERVKLPEKKGTNAVIPLIKRLREQSLNYITIFRDGQDTKNRDFSFIREFTIEYDTNPNITFYMRLAISKDNASTFTGEIKYSGNGIKNQIFNQTFIEKLNKEVGAEVKWEVYDDNGSVVNKGQPDTWRKGKIDISLVNGDG